MVEPEYDCEDMAKAQGAPSCWCCERALVEIKQMPDGWTWTGHTENTCERCYKNVKDYDDPAFSDLVDAIYDQTMAALHTTLWQDAPANAVDLWKRIKGVIL